MRFSDAAEAARQAAAEALLQGKDGGEAAAARAAVAAAEAVMAAATRDLGLQPALDRLACAAGCAPCCHQVVGVTGAELAMVKEAVAALPAETRAAIAEGTAAAREKGAGLDLRSWWQARIRCPLLGEGELCVIHQARPLPCRGHNSASAEACRRSLAGEPVQTPVFAAQHGIFGHAQAGLAQALAAAGRQSRVVNLALSI